MFHEALTPMHRRISSGVLAGKYPDISPFHRRILSTFHQFVSFELKSSSMILVKSSTCHSQQVPKHSSGVVVFSSWSYSRHVHSLVNSNLYCSNSLMSSMYGLLTTTTTYDTNSFRKFSSSDTMAPQSSLCTDKFSSNHSTFSNESLRLCIGTAKSASLRLISSSVICVSP